jgi:hypothetical protein
MDSIIILDVGVLTNHFVYMRTFTDTEIAQWLDFSDIKIEDRNTNGGGEMVLGAGFLILKLLVLKVLFIVISTIGIIVASTLFIKKLVI